MKSILIALSFMIIGNSNIFGTAQYADEIIIKGKKYMLHSNPMEVYFEKYPDKKPKRGIITTALWRGYIATFIVKENEMYLKDVEIRLKNEETEDPFDYKWQSVINDILKQGEELKIDWVTGILTIPYGKIRNYVHLGYHSTYNKYILLEVEKGNISKLKKFKYKQYIQFKKKQFEAFKKTKEYNEIVEGMRKNSNNNDEYIDSHLEEFIIEYISKFIE